MPNSTSLRIKPAPPTADANEFRKAGGIGDKQALAWEDLDHGARHGADYGRLSRLGS
jgi:hypothetical protein